MKWYFDNLIIRKMLKVYFQYQKIIMYGYQLSSNDNSNNTNNIIINNIITNNIIKLIGLIYQIIM